MAADKSDGPGSKFHYIKGAARAVELTLTAEKLAWLEEPYAPHALAGVMAQNTASTAKKPHVWGIPAIRKSNDIEGGFFHEQDIGSILF